MADGTSKLSVMITTAKRASMLRMALDSVARQTALQRVHQVVVIENGSDRASERVCAEFPQLPIHYVFRDPPIPPGTQPERFMDEVRAESFAFLCDDDWWSEGHVAAALRVLDARPDVSAYYGSGLMCLGEYGPVYEVMGDWLAWFAARGEHVGSLRYLALADMIVATLVRTPFHLSSLVARRDAFDRSLGVYRRDNPFDTDRHLAVEIARYGVVAFNADPHVWIRAHPGQENQRLAPRAEALFRGTTQAILEIARAEKVDVRAEYAARLAAAPGSAARIADLSLCGSVEELINAGLFPDEHASAVRARTARGRLRRWIPPALADRLERAKAR